MQNMRLAEMTRVWEERVWVTRIKKMIQEPLFFLYINIFFLGVEIFSPQLSLFTNTTWAHAFTCRISDVVSEWKK